jgi:hypothetical protein
MPDIPAFTDYDERGPPKSTRLAFGGYSVDGRATTTMKKATTAMKKRNGGSKEGNGGGSPSQLIDARIEELGDWRGETLWTTRPASSTPASRAT